MNLPNKITLARILMTLAIILILVFPFYMVNISFPKIIVNEKLILDSRYIISGILFILASITDFFDGYLARKYKLVTDFGKVMDAIADKVLVNSLLIILCAHGFISPIITVIVVMRDSVVNSIKMLVGSKSKAVAAIWSGKIKTCCLMIGIILKLFYNLPFELFNLNVADFMLILATVMAIISGVEYYIMAKPYLFPKKVKN